MSVIERDRVHSNIVSLKHYQDRKHHRSEVKIVHQNNSNVEQSKNKIVKNYEFESKMNDFIVQLNTIAQELTQTSIQYAPGKESGDDMEKMTERISNLERDVAVLKERTTKLDDLPTKAEIKVLFTDSINNSNLATKDHVNSKVEQTHTSIIKWMVGTTIALGGLIIAVIKIF